MVRLLTFHETPQRRKIGDTMIFDPADATTTVELLKSPRAYLQVNDRFYGPGSRFKLPLDTAKDLAGQGPNGEVALVKIIDG